MIDVRRGIALAALVSALVLPATARGGDEHAEKAMEQGAQPAMSAEQQAMMEAWQKAMTPGPEHARLAALAGDWKMTVKTWMDPAAPPEMAGGTVHRRMILGGRYLEETVESTMMGQPFEGRGLTGYDNVTGKYWSTWVDSMSTGLMTSTGSFDPETGIGTFWGTYVDPGSGQEGRNKSTVEHVSDDREVFTMYDVKDGREIKMMEITYERQ